MSNNSYQQVSLLRSDIPIVGGFHPGFSAKERGGHRSAYKKRGKKEKVINIIALGALAIPIIFGGLSQVDFDGPFEISVPQLAGGGDPSSGHTMFKGLDVGADNFPYLDHPSIGRAVHDEQTVISARDEGDEPAAAHPKRIRARAGKPNGLSAPPMLPLDTAADNPQNHEKQAQLPEGCYITYSTYPNPNPENLPSGNYNWFEITIDNATKDYDPTALAIEYINILKTNGRPLPYSGASERLNVQYLRNVFYDGLNHPISGEGFQDGKIIKKFSINVENGEEVPVQLDLKFNKELLEAAIHQYNQDCNDGNLPKFADIPMTPQEIAEREEAAARQQEAEENKSEREKAFEEWIGETTSSAKESYGTSAAIVAIIAGLLGYLAGSKKSS